MITLILFYALNVHSQKITQCTMPQRNCVCDDRNRVLYCEDGGKIPPVEEPKEEVEEQEEWFMDYDKA